MRRRRAAIEDFYTDDCVVVAPDGTSVGHDALNDFAGDLRATHPDYVYTQSGEPQVVQDAGIVAWASGLKDEEPEYTGLDVLLVRDGKIAALYVFLNPKLS